MPTPIEFIIFATMQAKEAEAFGFTRNECCRNLKVALHQYWQHRSLQLSSLSRKSEIPRSRKARKLPLSECIVEHVVPKMEIVNWLMDMEPLTERRVSNLLRKYYRVMLVTRDEHALLNASGLRAKMPKAWDRKNVLARYDMVGIKPCL